MKRRATPFFKPTIHKQAYTIFYALNNTFNTLNNFSVNLAKIKKIEGPIIRMLHPAKWQMRALRADHLPTSLVNRTVLPQHKFV
jgi:hypothetical protein